MVLVAMGVGYGISELKFSLATKDDRFDYLYHHPGNEISRTTSPDGKLEAVIFEEQMPAFSSNITYLHIFPAGQKPTKYDAYSASALLVSNRVVGVHWTNPSHLEIDPGTGTLRFFTNFWVPAKKGLPFVELNLVSSTGQHVLKPDGSFEDSIVF